MKVLLDLNIVLDVLLTRQPWFADASRIWDSHRLGQIRARLAAISLPTLFYVVRRQTDLKRAHDAVRICLETFEVVPVQRSTLEAAHAFAGSDFEDNIQLASAIESGVDALITRDPAGFSGAPIPVLSPADLLSRLSSTSP